MFKFYRDLQKKLKRQVNELICIKNQFQTISENIEIYSQQLEAVKKDFIDMNNKLKELRQQGRFMVDSDERPNCKNSKIIKSNFRTEIKNSIKKAKTNNGKSSIENKKH